MQAYFGGEWNTAVFNYVGDPAKLVQTCLRTKKDVDSIFHHCGGPAKLVQTCFSFRKELKSSF